MSARVFLVLGLVAAFASNVGQAGDTWQGAHVVPKSAQVMLTVEAHAVGGVFDIEWPAQVQHADGQWLWIADDGGYSMPPVAGWVAKDDVVKAEDAPAYFTAEILRDPSPALHWLLGICWESRGDAKAAIAEYKQAEAFFPDAKLRLRSLEANRGALPEGAKKAIVSGRDVSSTNRQKHFAVAQIWRTVYNAALAEKEDVEDEAECITDRQTPSDLEIAVIRESAAAVDAIRETIEARYRDDQGTAQRHADEAGSKARALLASVKELIGLTKDRLSSASQGISKQADTLAEFQPAKPSPDYKKIASTLETLVDAMADVKDNMDDACRIFNAVTAATCAARHAAHAPVLVSSELETEPPEARLIDEPSRAAESVQTALYEVSQALSDAQEAIERMAKAVPEERTLGEKANALKKAKNELEIARLSVLAAMNAVDHASYGIESAVQRLPKVAASADRPLKWDRRMVVKPEDLRTTYGTLAGSYGKLAELNFNYAVTEYQKAEGEGTSFPWARGYLGEGRLTLDAASDTAIEILRLGRHSAETNPSGSAILDEGRNRTSLAGSKSSRQAVPAGSHPAAAELRTSIDTLSVAFGLRLMGISRDGLRPYVEQVKQRSRHAADLLEIGLRYQPENFSAHQNRGMAYLLMAKMDLALSIQGNDMMLLTGKVRDKQRKAVAATQARMDMFVVAAQAISTLLGKKDVRDVDEQVAAIEQHAKVVEGLLADAVLAEQQAMREWRRATAEFLSQQDDIAKQQDLLIAKSSAEMACEKSDFQDVDCLRLLAMVYATLHDYSKAEYYQNRAAYFAVYKGMDTQLAALLKERDLYRQRMAPTSLSMPWHDNPKEFERTPIALPSSRGPGGGPP